MTIPANEPEESKSPVVVQRVHLGAGQGKHLPQEAWHVVEQKQGRVKPTPGMQDHIDINDDAGLEKEADTMGKKRISNK